MVATTRLGQQAIGVRPYLGFVAKALESVEGPHPFSDGTRLGQQAIGVRPYLGFVAKIAEDLAVTNNIVFSQAYNMIYPEEEDAMRPTSASELIIRKRDKKPIITGGDNL